MSWWSELDSNQPIGLFRPALIRLSYPTSNGARGETRTHDTGFAIRRLSRLATRASWYGRRDSNSRIEFGRLACFRLHHFRMREWNSRQDSNPQPRRSKRRALPVELQEQKYLVHRTG